MGKIFTMKVRPNDDRIFFVAGDWHIRLHDPVSINVLINHALTIPPELRVLIINGDFIDLSFLMKKHVLYDGWIKHDKGMDLYFLPMFKDEIKEANEVLDRLCKTFPMIFFGFGNHCTKRVKQFLKQCPDKYKSEFDIKAALHLDARGIFSFPYNTYLDVGPVSICHGSHTGASAFKRHFESVGRTIIISHLHSSATSPFRSRLLTHHVHSTGAMCLEPTEEIHDYMEWRDDNWDRGYITFQIGIEEAWIYHHLILNDKLKLPSGEIIYGKA